MMKIKVWSYLPALAEDPKESSCNINHIIQTQCFAWKPALSVILSDLQMLHSCIFKILLFLESEHGQFGRRHFSMGSRFPMYCFIILKSWYGWRFGDPLFAYKKEALLDFFCTVNFEFWSCVWPEILNKFLRKIILTKIRWDWLQLVDYTQNNLRRRKIIHIIKHFNIKNS